MERLHSTTAMVEMDLESMPGMYDLKHLRNIHKRIFGEVYDWAGEIRTINIGKGATLFANYNVIQEQASITFSALRKDPQIWVSNDKQVFAERMAYHASEINMLHPFREGNGRAQRFLFDKVGSSAGWCMDWSALLPEENVEMFEKSSQGDLTTLTEMLVWITETSYY